jgi:hypothetical protein
LQESAPQPYVPGPAAPADIDTDTERPLGTALAQIRGTYILSQTAHGVVLVDMHAGHERVLYEQFKSQYANGMPSQALLEPLVVELAAHELDALLEGRAEWERAGFELDALGHTRLALRRVPALLSGAKVAQIVREVAHDLDSPAPYRRRLGPLSCDTGLSHFGARQSTPVLAGNGCAVAADGADIARQSMQSRSAYLGAFELDGTGPTLSAWPLGRRRA